MKLNEGPRVISIICARGGSKGLPRKNLLTIDGEALISRAVRHAKEANVSEIILVSTDSKEIANAAIKAGAIVPFLRPPELSDDLATTEETLRHALISYEALVGKKFDICVFLTATDIFRSPEWITKAVGVLRDRPEIESVFVGFRTHKNFWEKDRFGQWVRLRSWMSVYSSRQIRQFVVREDTGLACASRSWLWRQGRRIGDRVEILVIDDDFTSIDIHCEDDLKLAQAALNIRKNASK